MDAYKHGAKFVVTTDDGVAIEVWGARDAAHAVEMVTSPGPDTPTRHDVNMEAERRITARYPVHVQLNMLRGGDPARIAEMSAAIDRIRAASNALTAMVQIPGDYRDDRHWGV